MKRISELVMTACFLAFLAAALVLTVSRKPAAVSLFENRRLAVFPECSGEALGDGSFVLQLERYLDDHAALRSTLLRVKTRADLMLRRPVVNNIVITEERLLPYLPVGRGVADPAAVEQKAQEMATRLREIRDTTAEYGGYYCYAAVPCQYAYFEDDYPWFLYNRKDYTQTAAASLGQALAEQGVPFLDAGAAFNAMGHPDSFGSRVDNHYPMEVGFAVYRLIMEKAAAESGLEFPILGPEDVTFETLPGEYLGSRERKLLNLETREEHLSILRPVEDVPFTREDNGEPAAPDVYLLSDPDTSFLTYKVYMGGDHARTVIRTNREELPSILIYGDSFTNTLECVAYLSFNEMHSLDLRHYREMSLQDYIRTVQPDIVICVRDYETLLTLEDNGGGA